jgi:hypothetical protein
MWMKQICISTTDAQAENFGDQKYYDSKDPQSPHAFLQFVREYGGVHTFLQIARMHGIARKCVLTPNLRESMWVPTLSNKSEKACDCKKALADTPSSHKNISNRMP